MNDKQPLAEALRSEILKLATEGDPKKEGILTADVLLRIMRVAKTGRELLVSLETSPSNLANMLKRPRGAYIPMLGDNTDDEDGLGESQGINPFSMSSPGENFGMIALREIIAVLKNNFNGNGSSPTKLVEAIAIAKEKGLEDVAKELESQLGVGKKTPASITVQALERKENGA